MNEIRLVVQGDDLGMCHAVNEGIQRAFEEGILSQTVAMAPCGWLDEAAAFAKASGIHLGMHCTLTSEWLHLRWRPLTQGGSLAREDGTFHPMLQTAMERLDPDEAAAELDAQYEHLRRLGIEPAYFDCHMGPTSLPAFAHVVEKHARAFLYPMASLHYTFDSLQMLTDRAAGEKLAWTLDYLDGLGPGCHYLNTHPAVASAELSSLTRPDAENACWASDYRVSDLEVLTSNAVRDRLDERGIALINVAELEPTAAA